MRLLAIALLALTGCSVTSFQAGSVKFSRHTLGTDTTLAGVSATMNPDGSGSISLTNLNLNQSAATIKALDSLDKIIEAAKEAK